DALLQLGGLVGEPLVLGGQLASGGQVVLGRGQLVVGLDHRGQFGITPTQFAGTLGIGVHAWVGELPFQLGVLVEQALQGRGVQITSCACRSGPRTGPPGRRCPESSACPCRTGGSWSRPRRECGPTSWCCGSRGCCRSCRPPGSALTR